jgi:rod shape-determining protein MreD
MIDPITSRRLLFRSLFVLMCGLIMFGKLLPLSTLPSNFPSADLLFVFTAVWIMRRPNFAPVWLIVPLHLLADFLFLRPPGLWTAISLLGFEFLRNKRMGPSEIPIIGEIPMAAGTFAVMFVVYSVVLTVFGVQTAGVWPGVLHILMTIVAYPFAILVSHFIFRVRRLRPGDLEDDGALA